MGRLIVPARLSNDAPTVISGRYATGQTFIKGAILARTAGELVEATSPITGATIAGVALEACASRPGYDAANSPTVVTGRKQEISYVVADDEQIFSAQLVNNSTVVVAPTTADIGVAYGIKPQVVSSKNEWYVDKSQTAANSCCTIVDIDTDLNIVFFKFLSARLAV
jgi:hypothetical protein